MKIIAHRINSISQLLMIPKNFGIELDVRYHEDELVLHRDPFSHQNLLSQKISAELCP